MRPCGPLFQADRLPSPVSLLGAARHRRRGTLARLRENGESGAKPTAPAAVGAERALRRVPHGVISREPWRNESFTTLLPFAQWDSVPSVSGESRY
jgi:hypothetical protein